MLQIGNSAPHFALPNQDGITTRPEDFPGKKIVLFFYLKDDSADCSKQVCSFRDNFEEIEQRNTVILGVSLDNIMSHQHFISKYNLPFQLLSDVDTKLAVKYGVYGDKIMYGKHFMGIHRTTFIINEERKISHIIKKAKAASHAKEVLTYLTK
jgi:thioredoxin-dependent peroxiredoxin